MSIKERLYGKSLKRERNIISFSSGKDAEAEWVKSTEILKQTQIQGVLEELYKEVFDMFPDAQIVPVDKLTFLPKTDLSGGHYQNYLFHLLSDGSAELRMRWDVRQNILAEEEKLYHFNQIKVSADPFSSNITVEGQDKEVISEKVWRSKKGKAILEDAIVLAYKNPSQYQNVHLLNPLKANSK